MEALVVLFAEVIALLMMPVLSLMGALIGAVLELVVGLFGLAFSGGRTREQSKAPPRKPLVSRKALHWSAGGLLVVGAGGVLASLLFFEQILRFGLDRVAASSGVEISYEHARGNLLKGQVMLEAVHMRRAAQTGVSFDITAERVALDAVLTSLLGRPEITSAEVKGVRGNLVLPQRDEESTSRKRRDFVVSDISISDVALDIRPQRQESFAFVITHASVAPFHSRLALFSLLFRSNMEADIAGQHLSVATQEITEFGRETAWRFENVETDRLKSILPRAPVTWLTGGTVSVRVDDKWSLSDDWIEIDWNVQFKDVQAAAPEGAGLRERAMAEGFGKLLALRDGEAAFNYTLRLDEDDIATVRGGGMDGLDAFWDEIAGQLITSAATPEAEGAAQSVDGEVTGTLGRLRDFLDREGQ
jgi:hypothetical protein